MESFEPGDRQAMLPPIPSLHISALALVAAFWARAGLRVRRSVTGIVASARRAATKIEERLLSPPASSQPPGDCPSAFFDASSAGLELDLDGADRLLLAAMTVPMAQRTVASGERRVERSAALTVPQVRDAVRRFVA